MNVEQSTVFVVDDDISVRDALTNLLRSVGLGVETFESAEEFLASARSAAPGCLVVDVRLPGCSGLELQRHLAESDVHMPVILITAHGDIPMSVRALKRGAVDFLSKPFRDKDLLDAVQEALARDRMIRCERARIAEVRDRHLTLTVREREVMALVVRGLANKQIAYALSIAEHTVKNHVKSILSKLGAQDRTQAATVAIQRGIIHL